MNLENHVHWRVDGWLRQLADQLAGWLIAWLVAYLCLYSASEESPVSRVVSVEQLHGLAHHLVIVVVGQVL